MSQVIDHETGKPIITKDDGVSTGTAAGLVVGTGFLTTVAVNEAARTTVVEAGKVVLKTIAKNPKLAVALAGLGVVAYSVKRMTEKGSELRIGSFFKHKRN